MSVSSEETLLPNDWILENIFSKINKIAKFYPDQIAISDNFISYTYKELVEEIIKYAQFIDNNKINPNDPIGIWLNNSPQFIIGMLACTTIGLPYVPLDSDFPLQRNIDVLKHGEVQLVLSDETLSKQISQYISVPIICLEVIIQIEEEFKSSSKGNDLCYILYTSGSTGKPKGVFQNQTNLLHDVWQYINSISLKHTDNCTLLYSPSVNGAIRDIYGTLLSGATLYLYNIKKLGLIGLTQFLLDNKITIYHSVPTIFRSFLKATPNIQFDYIRLVYLAGDRIFSSDYELFKKHFPLTSRLYVGIGSTENATIYRQWLLDHHQQITSELLPVGFEVEDREMNIIDENGNKISDGEIGEIEVTSKYMALGYWKDEVLTQQSFKFLANEARVFKTGDLGMINNQGLLEFKGRKDKQLKINGHRVEPDEVLAKIQRIKSVDEAAIIIRSEHNNSKIIVYLKTQTPIAEIRSLLVNILPQFMLPHRLYVIDEIPKLGNFKINYQALNEIDQTNYLQEKTIQTSGTSIEETFKSIWCKFTTEEAYNTDQSWNNSGASSIDIVTFWSLLEETFSISFPIMFIHVNITPSKTLEYLLKLINEQSGSKKQNEGPLVIVFPSLNGIGERHKKLIEEVGKNTKIKMIHYPKLETLTKKDSNFKGVCSGLISKIPKDQQMIFLGLSNGSYFAQEISRQLFKSNRNIQNIFFNCEAPRTKSIKSLLSLIKFRLFKLTKSKEYNSLKYIYKSANLQKSEVSTVVISMNNYMYKRDVLLGWTNYFTNRPTKIHFPFNHREMILEGRIEKVSDSIVKSIIKV